MSSHRELFVQYRSAKVLFMPDGYFFKIHTGNVNIDADGAPNAYGPPTGPHDRHGCGIDSLENACYPPGANDPLGQEDWTDILVPDPKNPSVPFLKPDGYYISQTTLCDERKDDFHPDKFLDATKVPYLVMPQFWVDRLGVRLGDLAVLMHSKLLRPVVAIVGDFCPFAEEIGEMAIATAVGLGATDVSPTEGATFPRGEISCRLFFKSMPVDLFPIRDGKLQEILPNLASKHHFDPIDPDSYMKGQIKVDTP